MYHSLAAVSFTIRVRLIMTAGLKVLKSIFFAFISAIEAILWTLILTIGIVLYPVPLELAGKAKLASLQAIELIIV